MALVAATCNVCWRQQGQSAVCWECRCAGYKACQQVTTINIQLCLLPTCTREVSVCLYSTLCSLFPPPPLCACCCSCKQVLREFEVDIDFGGNSVALHPAGHVDLGLCDTRGLVEVPLRLTKSEPGCAGKE